MHRPRLMFCAVAVAIGIAAASAPVLARPLKVALVKIDGDETGLSKAIAEALGDTDLDLVSAKRVRRTMEMLGFDDKLGDRDVIKVAAELDVDAIVRCMLEDRGRRLRVTIFANGKKAKLFTVPVGDPGSDKFRKAVRTMMLAKLAAAVPTEGDDEAGEDARAKKRAKKRPAGASGEEVAEADDGAKQTAKAKKARSKDAEDEAAPADDGAKKTAKGKKAKPKDAEDEVAQDDGGAKKKPKAKSKAEDGAVAASADAAANQPDKPKADAAAEAGSRPAPEGDEPRATKQVAARDGETDAIAPGPSASARFEPSPRGGRRSANLVAARADLGTSMSARDLSFKNTALTNPPMRYTNTLVPGGRFEGEIYPLALADRPGLLAGIGVAGDFDQTMALTLRASAEMTVPLKTTERHYSVGLRYRIALGHTPTSPTVTLGGGYAARMFTVDRKGLMSPGSLDLPDVSYKLYDPGFSFRLPIGSKLAVTLSGRALLVTSAGRIQNPDQYGQSKIIAGTASAGVEYIYHDRFAFRVVAEATQFNFTFAGTGTLSISRDGNPATTDVSGATDRYLGGAATLAVLY